jgi:hypothetical protein
MPPPRTTARTAAADRYRSRFRKLRQQLRSLEYFCKGTVLQRRMKCGQPACACHTDPSRRHGPYWEWTYKAQGKTVNVRLRPEVGPIYKAAAQQYRRLHSLLTRLERVSRTALLCLAMAQQANSKGKA